MNGGTQKPIIGLAPMDGITDQAMRHIFATTEKPDIIFTEQVSIEAIVQAFDKVEERLAYSDAERPIIVQLSGYDPQYYYSAVKRVAKLGFDEVNLNLGCPVKTVNRHGQRRGAGLIEQYQLVEEIINKTNKGLKASKTDIPLSVKTRLGISRPNTKEWVGFLADMPIKTIYLHGRTFKQGYRGQANWEEIGIATKIAHQKGKLLFGNGDVANRREGEKLCQKYGCDGILIGRGARGNPWAFATTERQPAKDERIKILIQHGRYFERTRGKRPFREFRKHLGWYLRGFPGARDLRAKLIAVNSYQELVDSLKGSHHTNISPTTPTQSPKHPS